MPRVKEVDDISKEIIKKLDEAIVQTVNARLFYEKYTKKNTFLCEMKFIMMKQLLAKSKSN